MLIHSETRAREQVYFISADPQTREEILDFLNQHVAVLRSSVSSTPPISNGMRLVTVKLCPVTAAAMRLATYFKLTWA